MRVLFLCTGNSCRSILAEAVFNHLAPERWPAWSAMSAGSRPVGEVHPRALALLRGEGIAVSGLTSKSWDHLPTTPEVVVTVCGNAANETCPAYLEPAVKAHWGVDDPARVRGTASEINAAFRHAYDRLRTRIEALLALPLDALAPDRTALARELTRIGGL